jgi:TonB family protein
LGQTLCPRHIETPIYPTLAQIAHVQGKVTLKVAIDADGRVTNVEVADDPGHQAQQVLQKSAIDSMSLWTFERPASAPVSQLIIYEYKFDGTLPVNDHQNPITKVNLDLPDRVTILSNELVMNPSKAKKKLRSPAP